MYKKRNLCFACLWTLVTSIVFGLIGILNKHTFIGILVFYFVPTLLSTKFNKQR